MQVLAAAYKALAPKGLAGDNRAEKQLVALLTIPLTKYDVVTGLGLSEYMVPTCGASAVGTQQLCTV